MKALILFGGVAAAIVAGEELAKVANVAHRKARPTAGGVEGQVVDIGSAILPAVIVLAILGR